MWGTRNAAKVLRSKFKSDGCTGIPDFWFLDACREHDWEYYIGGDGEDRLDADRRLRRRIMAKSHFGVLSPMANMVYAGVRLFGLKHFNYQQDDRRG
jgi:hypothetical protein